MTRFEIEGDPVAWRRTRGSGSERFTPKKQRIYRNKIIIAAKRAGVECIEEGPVQVRIVAYWKCRKSDERVRNPYPGGWKDTYPDADNVGKIILDAIQKGLALTDDGQVASLEVQTRWAAQGEPARVVVEVWRLGE